MKGHCRPSHYQGPSGWRMSRVQTESIQSREDWCCWISAAVVFLGWRVCWCLVPSAGLPPHCWALAISQALAEVLQTGEEEERGALAEEWCRCYWLKSHQGTGLDGQSEQTDNLRNEIIYSTLSTTVEWHYSINPCNINRKSGTDTSQCLNWSK